jgi:hypothetical protein
VIWEPKFNRAESSRSTPTTAHISSSTADIIGSGSPGKKHIHGQMQKPKLSLSGLLSSPSSSAGGERTSPSLDARSLTFPRYAPSGMRSPTTPTATGNVNVRSFSGINSLPSDTNAYTTPSSSASSSSANPNASINPQIQPSHPSTHGHGHGTMASAKALLRRVRSGSSLRPGIEVHPEER